MKNCQRCGKEIADNAMFCPECGAKIINTTKTPPRIESFGNDINKVDINQMLAKVQIIPSATGLVTVIIDGDEEIKVTADVGVTRRVLKISAPYPFIGEDAPSSASGHNIFGGNIFNSVMSSGMSIVNDRVMVNGRTVDMNRLITVTVAVPVGATIRIDKLLGAAQIGDIQGDLDCAIQSKTIIAAGQVKNLTVSISGQGEVQVTEASGLIDANINGAGKVRVSKGKVTSFNAIVSGAGNISFLGVADTSHMRVSGMGNIYLTECLSVPQKQVSGLGEIIVERAPSSSGRGFSDW